MLSLVLGIGCTFALLVALYFFRKASHLGQENLQLRKQSDELSGRLEVEVDKALSQVTNQFLEIENVLKNERERIAHDLHDDIVQRFVSIRLRLEQLLYFPLRPEVEIELNSLRTEIGNALRDLRYVIENMVQPQIEHLDFNELVDEMISKLKLITKIRFELRIDQPDRAFRLTNEVKKELYLLTKEAIQNSMKHSAGNVIWVLVSWDSALKVEISADGVGFLKSRAANVGLNSMQHRCAKIGATFQAFNKMGRFHSVVIITLPQADQTSPLR